MVRIFRAIFAPFVLFFEILDMSRETVILGTCAKARRLPVRGNADTENMNRTDSIMAREARKANRKDEKGKWIYTPADRMRENAWIAAFMYPAALIWYGWTAEKGVHWIAPVSFLFQTDVENLRTNEIFESFL